MGQRQKLPSLVSHCYTSINIYPNLSLGNEEDPAAGLEFLGPGAFLNLK